MEDVAHGVDDGLHLAVGTRLSQENQEQHRDDAVDIHVGIKIGDAVPKVEEVAQGEGKVFAEDDSDVIEQQEQNRRRECA